jgi:polyhydroxyalkanoate synthesis regulator phasin
MMQNDFGDMIEEMNEAVADSIEQNMEAQAAFVESWADAFEETVPEDEELSSGFEGYSQAYEVWMDATEEMFEEATNVLEGEDFEPAEFRDIWLQSANEAFSEVMSTSAFAAANGQLVENILDIQQDIDEVTEESLASMNMPTQSDVEEVGERLVELERRQHAVERKLDRLLDELED